MRTEKMRSPQTWLRSYYRPYIPFFFRSGTQALAAALCSLRRLRPGRRNVLIPGYTCPSLVSAARFAGCRAIPVDVEPESPRIDIAGLERNLDDNVLAVVAADLFGIPERCGRLGELAHAAGAWLIEDAAQRLSIPPYSENVDIAVLSYGRGKPVSVLEGGGLLLRSPDLIAPVAAVAGRVGSGGGGGLHRHLKAALYNLMRHPSVYWLPAGLPLLGLGKTEYRRLEGIETMPPTVLAWLPANLPGTAISPSAGQRLLEAAAQRWSPSVQGVAGKCGAAGEPLSRMPLLADSAALKERLVTRLARFGASPMYPSAVTAIPGAFPGNGTALSRELPNATELASRLFTLPTHEWVDRRSVAAIETVVHRELDMDAAEVTE